MHSTDSSERNNGSLEALVPDSKAAAGALEDAATRESTQLQRSDIVPGWDPELRQLFDRVAQHWPDLLGSFVHRFESHAREQAAFALALEGKHDWPASAMAPIARHFLNSPRGTFAYENAIPVEKLRAGTVKLLTTQAHPLMQWQRLELLLPEANDDFRVLAIVNYCAEDFRSKAFLMSSGTEERLIPKLMTALNEPGISFAGSISAALLLTASLGRAWGSEVPSAVQRALSWDLRSGNDVEADVSLRAYSHLDTSVAGDLLRACLEEPRAIALIPAIDDRRVLDELLDRVEGGAEVTRVMSEALIACGERAREALVERCERQKLATGVGLLAAEVLGQALPPAIDTLVALLGHPSKRVAATAAKSIELLDEQAEAPLQVALRSRKKSIRGHAERLLSRLDNRQTKTVTPLGQVQRRASELSEAERSAFLSLWSAKANTEENWQATLKPAVQTLGCVALELLREWFRARLEEGETRLWCYAVEELKSDPDAVWVAVDSFSKMPKLAASLWARPRRALSHCGPLLGAPIVHVLQHSHTEYREPLFGLLASHATDVEHGIFLSGLNDPSKTVRTHCVDGLSRVGNGPWQRVAAMLSASETGTRVAAAELLAVWGRSEAAPQLAEAWDRERSGQVRPYLEDALVACGRTDLVFSLQPGSALDYAAAERDLLKQTAGPKPPTFVRLNELPGLRFQDGSAAPKQLRAGFLARLMQLDLSLKGRALRRLLPLFHPADVVAWGRALYSGWAATRSSKHKWAILQLSLLADDALLGEALSQLSEWKGGEHALVTAHLRAAQWHGSEESVQWLGYWAENLPSFGGRSAARQMFGRVAFKRGTRPAQLRRQLSPFIAEEQRERGLAWAQATGPERRQVMRELERSWLTAREWPAGALWKLLNADDSLEARHWLWRSINGKVCRFHTDQSILFSGPETPVLAPETSLQLVHPLDAMPQARELWKTNSQQATTLGQPETGLTQAKRATFQAAQQPELLSIRCRGEQYARWRRAEGWFHGEPMDGGIVYTNSLHLLKRNLIVTLHHSGYAINQSDSEEEIRILHLDFSDLDGQHQAADNIPQIMYSELHRSIRQLSVVES